MASLHAGVEDMVTCPICTSRLSQPKQLKCLHTFCLNCLDGWMKSPANMHSKMKVPCPTCRSTTTLSENGLSDLPSDFQKLTLLGFLGPDVSEKPNTSHWCLLCSLKGVSKTPVSYCEECDQFMCSVCEENHNSEPMLAGHQLYSDLSTVLSKIICSQHSPMKLDFFCPKCSLVVCKACMQTSHKGHGVQKLLPEYEKRRAEIEKLLEHLEKQTAKLELDEREIQIKAELEAMFEKLKLDVKNQAQESKLHTDTWLKETLSDLNRRQETLYKKVQSQHNSNVQYVTKVNSLKVHYKEQLRTCTPRELLHNFVEIISQADLYLQPPNPFNTPKLSFVPSAFPDKLGNIVITKPDSQHGSDIASNNDETCPEVVSSVSAGNAARSYDKYILKTIEMENVAAFGGKMVRRLCFGPAGSDWILGIDNIHLTRYWLSETAVEGESLQPLCRDIAMGSDGLLAIIEFTKNEVSVINITDTGLASQHRSLPLQKHSPFKVEFTLASQHIVFLSECSKNRIHIYNKDFEPIGEFGNQMNYQYLACGPNDQVVVATAKEVHCYTLGGDLLFKIDASCLPKSENDQFVRGISVDKAGHIFVAGINEVVLFSPTGTFLSQITPSCNIWTDICAISVMSEDSGGLLMALSTKLAHENHHGVYTYQLPQHYQGKQ